VAAEAALVRVGVLVAGVGFVALAVAAHFVAYFPVDLLITQAVQTPQHPTLEAIAEALDWPGFPPQSNVLFGGLVLLLIVCRQFLAAACQVLAAGGSAGLWFALTPLVDRPRPSPDLVHVSQALSAGSFPSGHVLNLGAGLGFAWYLAFILLPRGWPRTIGMWLLPGYLLLLGLARIYTGQHWPSDVLGGYLLAAVCLWICIAIYRYSSTRLAR
jgi:membrane-associated phospholipid phosphatase